ncbi:hypothetical protein BGZ59_003513 [Podila verticillata]|nr:hypothetical protein BGZ59_003513 [Podila verticillata]
MTTRPRITVKASFSALILSCSIIFAKAQAPQAIRRLGFVQVADKLYIQGGFNTMTFVQDFLVLDLATSWTTASPSWKTLPAGSLTSHHALAAVGDGQQILAMGGLNNPPSFVRSFDVTKQKWTNVTASSVPFPSIEGHSMVTDPNTGQVYVIGGNSTTNQYNGMMVYNPTASSFATQLTATNTTSLTDAGVVWSSVRQTILVFGGSLAPPANPVGLDLTAVREYDPVSKTWKTMTTSGNVPPARFDHCVAASEDGSKIVLFGGAKDSNTNYDTLYVLDVASAKWKQGQSAPSARTKFSCGFYKNQYVAFGGSTTADRKTMLNNTPVVYSLDQGQWVDSYSASESTGSPSSPSSPPSSSSSSSSSSNIGAIAGAAGGVVAILVAVGVWWFCRRKRLAKEREAYESDARAAAAIGREDNDDKPKAWKASSAQGHSGAHRESQQFLSHDKASQYRDDYPLDRLKNSANHGPESRDGYLKDPNQELEHDSKVSGYSDRGPSFSDSSNGGYSRVATSSSNPDSGKGGSEYVPPTPSTAYNFTGFSGSNSSQPSLQMSPAATGTNASFSPRPVAPSWFDNDYYQGKVSYYETESDPSATAFSPTASTARTSLYRGPHSLTEDSDPASSSWGSPYPQPPPQQQRVSRAPQDYNPASAGYYPPPPTRQN